MNASVISFPCLTVRQPIGTFYIGVMDSKDLLSIAYADVRRHEGRDIERYIGTERDLCESRVAEIKQYVTTVDACFPTSIILAIDAGQADYDDASGSLRIVKAEKVAKIIDGQHRIAGLEDYRGTPFQLNVTIFIDMDIEDQAMVFATINLKQTKVTKSLAYDLHEYAKSRTPQKTCHNIAKLLNYREGSPFHQRIKILGRAVGTGPQLITQAAFVDRLLRLISQDPMGDRDRIKRGKQLERPSEQDSRKLVFRTRFIEEKDGEIARNLWNYFKAVEMRWPHAWSNFERGQILARTTGFAALMRLLVEIVAAQSGTAGVIKVDAFSALLRRSRLEDKDFTSDRFKPGSSGESDLLAAFLRDVV